MVSEIIEGYLAYVDLMGFSNIIKSARFDDEFNQFCEIIEGTVVEGGTDLHYRFFSDSIVIFSKQISTKKLLELSGTISQICSSLMYGLGLTLCGGISCGKFTLYEHNNNIIFAGAPMVDAVSIEQNLNWLGVVFSPEVVKRDKSFRLMLDYPLHNDYIDLINRFFPYPKLLYYVQEYSQIPLKRQSGEEETISGFIITPQSLNTNNPEEAGTNLDYYLNELKQLKYQSSSAYVQKKYDNTFSILEEMIARWRGIQSKAIYDKSSYATED